jgi:hypothetical protein
VRVPDVLPVFVFPRGQDMLVFPDVDHAASWMEAIDVADGEYEAVYDTSGRLIEAEAIDPKMGVLVLHPSDAADPADLRRRIQAYMDRTGFPGTADDAEGVAREYLRREWDQRWPKRPSWLDRRLHGDPPT